jgi:hypothetical protein
MGSGAGSAAGVPASFGKAGQQHPKSAPDGLHKAGSPTKKAAEQQKPVQSMQFDCDSEYAYVKPPQSNADELAWEWEEPIKPPKQVEGHEPGEQQDGKAADKSAQQLQSVYPPYYRFLEKYGMQELDDPDLDLDISVSYISPLTLNFENSVAETQYGDAMARVRTLPLSLSLLSHSWEGGRS